MTFRSCLAVALVFTGLCGGVSAAHAAEPWTVVMGESHLGFVGTQAGSLFEGRFVRFTPEIRFSADDLATSQATIVIDMASASTGDTTKDSALPGADWFSVAKFPQARFVTRNFRHVDANRYEADGDLTIRDVTKDVVLPFTLDIAGDHAVMRGALTINRNDFGVGQGEWATSPIVGPNVEIKVDLTARRGG